MLQEAQNWAKTPANIKDPAVIKTTLYDLIEAVNETVKPNGDQFVTEIAMDMLIAGHAKFLNTCH